MGRAEWVEVWMSGFGCGSEWVGLSVSEGLSGSDQAGRSFGASLG